MSAPQRLSDDPTLKPLLKSTLSAAVKANELYNIKASDLQNRLIEAGWTGPGASEEGWKAGWKKLVTAEWRRMVVAYEDAPEQEDVKPKSKAASKYDRAAERNFNNFNAMVAGDLLEGLGGGEDDQEEEDFIASDSGVGASDDTGSATRDSSMDVGDSDAVEQKEEKEAKVPVKTKRKPKSSNKKDGKKSTKSKGSTSADSADKPKKKRSPKKKAEFKSKATISDSDDSSHNASASGSGRAGPSSSIHSEGESEEEKKAGRGKGRKTTGEKKARKKKERKPKEGEEPKGSDEEEDRISKLKALLKHAGVLRPFTKETGAERTLTVSTRLARLQGLLNDLGLQCGSGVGTRMPSEAKCKELGETKTLEKEVKDLKGAPVTSGLRDGKKRASIGADDDEDRPKKKFGAFLSAVQSDSD